MIKIFTTHGRALVLTFILLILLILLAYVALRSGPLAPIPVTVVIVKNQEITPALFGIGTVEARYTHKIGPTFAGRLIRVNVQPGDHVKAGQLLAEIDPIDLDDRIAAQNAALKRAEANVLTAEAQIQEAKIRTSFAETQSQRYEQLLSGRSVSAENAETKQQELQVAKTIFSAARANLSASRQEQIRIHADLAGLIKQRASLRLVAPIDGIVTRRDMDSGTTVIAGQSIIDIIEPKSTWINTRFDQQRASGLRNGLPAQIILRSRAGEPLEGYVSRIELNADPVTEELLAKVEFKTPPHALPPIGELAEVTVALPARKPMPVVPNACIQRINRQLGVWVIENDHLRFMQVKTGVSDLDGRIQIIEGLTGGERVVVYSQKALNSKSRIKIVNPTVNKPT